MKTSTKIFIFCIQISKMYLYTLTSCNFETKYPCNKTGISFDRTCEVLHNYMYFVELNFSLSWYKLSQKSFSSKMSKNKVFEFFKVGNNILKRPSLMIKTQTQWIVRAKKCGPKSQIRKVLSAFGQKPDFFIFEIFFYFFPRIVLKLIFRLIWPCTIRICQKKIGFCDIFEKFSKKVEKSLFCE
jgi:hypothetical protein